MTDMHTPSGEAFHLESGAPNREYYRNTRQDVLEHIPVGAQRVLSVGCGSGFTERELIRRGMTVTGIELDPSAAQEARGNGVQVIEGDVSAVQFTPPLPSFDCLLYPDVLEHLLDPLKVLRRHVALLRPGGRVIISVPNFRYCSVLGNLIFRGEIRYTDAGLYDRTHIRLTTRKMVLGWFAALGLRPVATHYTITGRRNRLLAACLRGLVRDFVGKQVMVIGEK